MPECSLCGNPMPEEGGAVLFADSRGVPFEVCGECEASFETLRNAADDAAAGQAVDYIFEKAGSVEQRRDVFDTLVEYVETCRPHAAAGPTVTFGDMRQEPIAEADSDKEHTNDAMEEPSADRGVRKRGFIKSGILVAVIVALLLLAWALSGFRLF